MADQVERLKPKPRAKVRYETLTIAATVTKGGALAAQRLLWELLDSGDWAEPWVLKQLPDSPSTPRDFLRSAVMGPLQKSTSTATLWADTLLFMQKYLYHHIYAGTIGIEPGDLIEDPIEALPTMFGRYLQVASLGLQHMAEYRQTGLNPVAATWGNLTAKVEDWRGLGPEEREERKEEGYFDPWHPDGWGMDVAKAWLALRKVRKLLALSHDPKLSQRQVYNKARGAEPPVRQVVLPREITHDLDPIQLEQLRAVPFLSIEGDGDSEYMEVQVKMEIWPACPGCRRPMFVSGDYTYWCPVCAELHTEHAQKVFWYWRYGDSEDGVGEDWLPILEPTMVFQDALVHTVQLGPLIGTVYDMMVIPSAFAQWQADHGIREIPAGHGIYTHRKDPGMRVRMLWEGDEDFCGIVLEPGENYLLDLKDENGRYIERMFPKDQYEQTVG